MLLTTQTARPWALKELPPFPPIALRVMEELSKEDPKLERVVGWINSDPSFAAELLRVANSALYSFSYEIISVKQAAITLGYDFVRSLAMTVALRNYLKQAVRIPALMQCWKHCLACAVISEEVGAAVGSKCDSAYTGGLLHDIGRLALMTAWPREYNNAVEAAIETETSLVACERELFEVDHCEAGLWLAAEWKLPVDLAETISRHHEPGLEISRNDLFTVVRAGCWLAENLGFGPVSMPGTPGGLRQFPELPTQLEGKIDLPTLMNSTAVRIAAIQ